MTGTLDEMMAEGPEPQRANPDRRWRLVAIAGVLLAAAGLGILGWIAWQYYGSNIIAHQRQGELRDHLHQQWDNGDAPLVDEEFSNGEAFALLRIPRFGSGYEMPIIKGVDDDALSSGVGWFPDTRRPGQLGNFALAGHRVTHGEPFADFPDLHEGDPIYVETRTHIYTYVLDDDGTDHEIPFSEAWILDPVPGDPDAQPTEALITLMTCSELFQTDQRSYVVGHLTGTQRTDRR